MVLIIGLSTLTRFPNSKSPFKVHPLSLWSTAIGNFSYLLSSLILVCRVTIFWPPEKSLMVIWEVRCSNETGLEITVMLCFSGLFFVFYLSNMLTDVLFNVLLKYIHFFIIKTTVLYIVSFKSTNNYQNSKRPNYCSNIILTNMYSHYCALHTLSVIVTWERCVDFWNLIENDKELKEWDIKQVIP